MEGDECLEESVIEQIQESYEDDGIIHDVAEEILLDEVESEEIVFLQEENKLTGKVCSSEKNETEKLFTFQCHLCAEPEFVSMKFLVTHCKRVHNCLPLVKCCSENCSTLLSTWRRLIIHKEKHFPTDDPTKFRCNECSR